MRERKMEIILFATPRTVKAVALTTLRALKPAKLVERSEGKSHPV
jgi:hypothetical protein